MGQGRSAASRKRALAIAPALLLLCASIHAAYVNFESSHVHPLTLTPSGTRLLVVNTPDALLEVFAVQPDGSLLHERVIRVGLEPVTVAARSDSEAWVVNNLSDTISIVDLGLGATVETLAVGDEPTDVVFAGGKAFVAVSQEDAVKVYDPSNLNAAPAVVPLFGRDVRALAVSADATKVYAVVLRSGNKTSVVNASIIFRGNNANMSSARLTALGLRNMACTPISPPPYPPLPAGITRNPALTDPPASSNPAQYPPVGLIVRWNEGTARWVDEAGQDWSPCLPYRLPDRDLFVIDVATLAVTDVTRLGTSLFEVSVNPGNGRIYVPNTDARNFVRFEHPLGVRGHVVDDRLSVVDPAQGHAATVIELNAHIDRGSNPATNLSERSASISQPGMLVWNSSGSLGYLTAIGSRKLFRVDGSCLSANCIFGPTRASPVAVEVGEGPTGAALLETADRVYVLNRISQSVTTVVASTMSKIDEIALHDPSSPATRAGRRFLYDAIDTSGHGDAACASCHLSGDNDGLAWDLGNPEGTLAPYDAPLDNVRFVIAQGQPPNGHPVECDPQLCAAHDGFDPQKGPMVTQTLRGMLEPLHWRGDRATMSSFNRGFVELMGTHDIGPIDGKPAGLSAEQMELFRQFALEIALPPNPYRKVDDTTPCGPRSSDPSCQVQPHGSLFAGNPTEGDLLFRTHVSDAGQTCTACHASPFGTAGGRLGGVTPAQPTSSDAAALFFGGADASLHSDLKIAHLRNMYDKLGPVWAAPAGGPPNTKTGFGFTHDGSIPDLFRFLSINVFTLSEANQAREVRDLVAFLFHFPTGTRPAVGRQVTVPAGTSPTGSPAEETLLATLLALGDRADANRHCELVASAVSASQLRNYHLSGGLWVTDVAGEASVSTEALRQGAQSAVTFTCVPVGSGPRLGGDRDEDQVLDGDDCAPADPLTLSSPQLITNLVLSALPTTLAWDDQSPTAGPSVRYDVLGGDLSALRAGGIGVTGCIASDLAAPTYEDSRANPPTGDGYYYLIRAVNACGTGGLGPGREELDTLDCP